MICVNSVNVYPSRIAIKTGTWYYNVHAEVCPTNATCPNVTWSSSDPSIAIVHPTSGYIHGGRPGTATIYATATDGSGKRGCCTVTVSQRIYVNSITLNTFQISIQRNNNYLLTAEVCPSNADNKAINWCSSNTEVATVSGGRVYAHKKGAAVITAAAADGSGTEAKCYVNVTENYLVVLITVEPACKTLAVGESVFLRETVYPNHATNKEVCWSSSNEYIATVNPTSGFVAAKHAGTATIYATAQDGSGKRGCCQITVIPPVHVTGITLCPQEQSIRIGETKQLEAVLSPANATNRSISWCSSNPDVVSVGYYSGIIRALSEGTAVITATASGGFQASCQIHVYAKKAIIIVPGIMGTKLKLNSANNAFPAGTQIWPPLEPEQEFDSAQGYIDALKKLESLACNDDGSSAYDIVVDNTDTYGSFETYKNLYLMLNNTYGADRDVLFFGYDWRKPNSVSGALLAEKVNTYDEVFIIAHSMGGLVASHMLRNTTARCKINKLVTLGTPYLGSIDTVPLLSHGEHSILNEVLKTIPSAFQVPVKAFLTALLQELAVNLPALYELLPTKQFFSLGNRFYFSIQILLAIENKCETFEETRQWLPEAKGYGLIGSFNMNLFDAATASHDLLWNGNTHITANVNTYYIAGQGYRTLKTYTYWESISHSYIPTDTGNGDGTVLYYSATMNDLYPQKTFFVISEHTPLANPAVNPALFEFTQSLINGGFHLPDGVDEDPTDFDNENTE